VQTDVLDTDNEQQEPIAEDEAVLAEIVDGETGADESPEMPAEEAVMDEAQALHAAAEAVTPAVEALLFVATEPLETKRIAKLTGEDEKAIALALQHLEERYSDGGIVLREVAGGYRLATSSLVRDVVEAYLLPPKTSLSTPALETLAIVAHMQPVTKSEIEAIRGVNSDSVVNTLIDRGLIGEAGRKDVVGRPMQYKTTSLFLESFGLNSIDDLPQLELEPGQPLELNLLAAPGESVEAAEEHAPASENEAVEEAPASADTSNDGSSLETEE
jgi:segregation and condensation protein B